MPTVRRPRVLLLVVSAALSGCVKYRQRPVSAPNVEAEFKARSLSDQELRGFVEANLPKSPSWPPHELDLSTLTLIALYHHPELELARAELAIAEAAILTAGAKPNPTLTGESGYSTARESAVVIDFAPMLTIRTAGKRGHQILQAQRLAEASRLRVAETAWRVRSRVRKALLDYIWLSRALELLRAEERVRSDAVDMIKNRLRAGEASKPELDVAQIQLSTAAVGIRTTQGEAAASLASLASAIGIPMQGIAGVPIVWGAADTLPAANCLPMADVQRAGLLNRVDVRRTLLEYAAAEANLQLAVARQYPDIQLGPRYTFEEAHHVFAFGPSLTLPIFNRNRGPIAEAEGHRREVEARFRMLEAQAIAEMDDALARYRAAMDERVEADNRLRVLQRNAAAAMRRAVTVGEQDRLALAGVELQTVITSRASLGAWRGAQAAFGALEDAVQRPLVPSPPLPGLPPEGAAEAQR